MQVACFSLMRKTSLPHRATTVKSVAPEVPHTDPPCCFALVVSHAVSECPHYAVTQGRFLLGVEFLQDTAEGRTHGTANTNGKAPYGFEEITLRQSGTWLRDRSTLQSSDPGPYPRKAQRFERTPSVERRSSRTDPFGLLEHLPRCRLEINAGRCLRPPDPSLVRRVSNSDSGSRSVRPCNS